MKYLRWALAALLGVYVAFNLMPLTMTALFKLGSMGEVPADAQRYLPLMEATTWWQLALWVVVLLLYVGTALRLVRGGKALKLYGAALALDLANLLIMRMGDVYTQVFTAEELMLDYYLLAALAAVGVAIWWTERDRSASAAAA